LNPKEDQKHVHHREPNIAGRGGGGEVSFKTPREKETMKGGHRNWLDPASCKKSTVKKRGKKKT